MESHLLIEFRNDALSLFKMFCEIQDEEKLTDDQKRCFRRSITNWNKHDRGQVRLHSRFPGSYCQKENSCAARYNCAGRCAPRTNAPSIISKSADVLS